MSATRTAVLGGRLLGSPLPALSPAGAPTGRFAGWGVAMPVPATSGTSSASAEGCW